MHWCRVYSSDWTNLIVSCVPAQPPGSPRDHIPHAVPFIPVTTHIFKIIVTVDGWTIKIRPRTVQGETCSSVGQVVPLCVVHKVIYESRCVVILWFSVQAPPPWAALPESL